MQDLFRTISQDGVMGPAEWTRCLGYLGVENEITSLRLFDMFDASGDKELNAKEFSFGLSDICNSFQSDTAPEDVRRNFAFRFYVSGGDGLFKEAECRSFLSSYRLSASRCVDRTAEMVTSSYGLDPKVFKARLLTEIRQLEQFRADRRSLARLEHSQRKRMTKQLDRSTKSLERRELDRKNLDQLSEEFDEHLVEIVGEIFSHFGNYDKKGDMWSMKFDEFSRFGSKAPYVVQWLTDLGQNIKSGFQKMSAKNFERGPGDSRAPDGAVLVPHRLVSAFHRACKSRPGGSQLMSPGF